jgi:hypothetical protein
MLALCVYSPFILAKNIYFSFAPPSSKLIKIWIDSAILGLPVIFAGPSMVYVLVRNLGEKTNPSLGEALGWGAHCFPRNFGYHFLTSLLAMVGLVCLVVPGVLVLLWYSLLTVVIAVEGPEQDNPMERSKNLVKEHMGLVFGAWLSLTLINLLAVGTVGLVLGLANGILQVILGNHGPYVPTDHWVMLTVIDLVSVMFNMNIGIMALCAYLTWSREGSREDREGAESPVTPAPMNVSRYEPAAAPKAKARKAVRSTVKKVAPKARGRAKKKKGSKG